MDAQHKRVLALNIVDKARVLAAANPDDIVAMTDKSVTELDYHIEDMTTALARRADASD